MHHVCYGRCSSPKSSIAAHVTHPRKRRSMHISMKQQWRKGFVLVLPSDSRVLCAGTVASMDKGRLFFYVRRALYKPWHRPVHNQTVSHHGQVLCYLHFAVPSISFYSGRFGLC